jgi:hypothetical protein
MLNERIEHDDTTFDLTTPVNHAGLDADQDAKIKALVHEYKRLDEAARDLTALDIGQLTKKIKGAIKSGDTATKKSADAKATSAELLEEAEAYYAEAGRVLIEAKSRVNETGENWGKWVDKNCRVNKARADQLIRISNGSTTVAAVREAGAARVAKHRAAKKAMDVTPSNVTSTNEQPVIVPSIPAIETPSVPAIETPPRHETPADETPHQWQALADKFRAEDEAVKNGAQVKMTPDHIEAECARIADELVWLMNGAPEENEEALIAAMAAVSTTYKHALLAAWNLSTEGPHGGHTGEGEGPSDPEPDGKPRSHGRARQ